MLISEDWVKIVHVCVFGKALLLCGHMGLDSHGVPRLAMFRWNGKSSQNWKWPEQYVYISCCILSILYSHWKRLLQSSRNFSFKYERLVNKKNYRIHYCWWEQWLVMVCTMTRTVMFQLLVVGKKFSVKIFCEIQVWSLYVHIKNVNNKIYRSMVH